MDNLGAAADAVFYQGSCIFGGKPGWGYTINGAPGRILAYTEGARMGIAMDAAILETSSRFGMQDGWNRGKHDENGSKLPSGVESRRAGLERIEKENGMIYEYGDHFPHLPGLVLPYDGGADILLRLPPTKCETMADLDERLANLSRAAMSNPRALLDAVNDGMGLTDAAQSALRAPVEADGMETAWEELAASELGEAMFRLKFCQIENKAPPDIIRDYQHETSLVLMRPPLDADIREYKETLNELANAVGERGLILTCEDHAPMAYLARERLGEGWTTVRMSDGNLLWKTWRNGR